MEDEDVRREAQDLSIIASNLSGLLELTRQMMETTPTAEEK